VSKPTHPTDAAVEAAIGEVLASRRNALDAVTQAVHDAERIAEEARDTTRGIAERTERRILRIRAGFDAACRAKIAAIDAETEVHDAAHELTPVDIARLARAVDALCEELTGPKG
jgi:hypothetical protein